MKIDFLATARGKTFPAVLWFFFFSFSWASSPLSAPTEAAVSLATLVFFSPFTACSQVDNKLLFVVVSSSLFLHMIAVTFGFVLAAVRFRKHLVMLGWL